MNRSLLHVLGALLLSQCAIAQEEYLYGNNLDLTKESATDSEADPRFFFIFTNATTGSFVTFNTTLLLFSAGILLWGIAGAVALYYLLTAPADTGSGYSSYGGSGSGSGYSSGRGRKGSFDPYSIDWEKFSILDWISIGQEAWEKFDPADADCQLRLICEIHQNTSKFGLAAQKMVDVFSYLQFTEVLSLPDEVKVLVEEWLNAADMGRTGRKQCGEIFQSCDFSVNKMVDKYTHNEI